MSHLLHHVSRLSLRRILPAILAACLALIAATPVAAPTHAGTAPSPAKLRWAYYVPWLADSVASLQQNIGALDYLSPYWYHMGGWGELSTPRDAVDAGRDAVIELAQRNGVKVVPLVQNIARYGDFSQVLQDPAIRAVAIQNLVQIAAPESIAGVHIDFEAIEPDDRPYLSQFMRELAQELQPRGKLVTQAVPARDRERTTGWAGAYDYAVLGQINDLVVLMTYGYGTGVPQSTAPYPWVASSAAYVASQMPPHKLLLGLAFYGYDWDLSSGRFVPLTHPRALARAEAAGVPVEYDETVHSAHFSYNASGADHKVWFEDGRAAAAKLDLVFRHGLAGAAGWRMGQEDPMVWKLYRERLGASPAAPAAPPPRLLAPASGAELNGLGATLSWTLPAAITQYQLQVLPFQGDGPAINLIRGPETSFTIPAPVLGQGPYIMLPGMSYTWRIRASSAATGLDEASPLWGPWSSESTFRTRRAGSAQISAVAPPDGAAVSSVSPVLRWANADPNVFYYEVEVSGDALFGEAGARLPVITELRHGGITSPPNSYGVPSSFPLMPGAPYYWRVRPRTQGDAVPVPWSRTFSFTVPR